MEQANSSLCILSHVVMSNSWLLYGLQPTKLLCLWDSPGKTTGVGCHALLQGIIPTQGSNPSLLCLSYWQVESLPLSHPRKPKQFIALQLESHQNSVVPGRGTENKSLAAPHSKASKEARLVERKVCSILDASKEWGGVGGFLSKGWLPPTDKQWAGPLIDQGRGLRAETTRSAPQSSSNGSWVV